MQIFLIQHKTTKLYFPEPTGREGRGGSFTEATSTGDNARIFRSKHSAKCFLTSWHRGQYHCSRSHNLDDYYEDVFIKEIPSRSKDDYEIIMKEVIL